jgi:hypothetical protein
MDYELAVKLRDAGFPQTGHGRWIGSPDKVVWRSGDRVYVPTLEELIEAFGDCFEFLENNARNWRARADNSTVEGQGMTPIEAVARLWLALYGDAGANV